MFVFFRVVQQSIFPESKDVHQHPIDLPRNLLTTIEVVSGITSSGVFIKKWHVHCWVDIINIYAYVITLQIHKKHGDVYFLGNESVCLFKIRVQTFLTHFCRNKILAEMTLTE